MCLNYVMKISVRQHYSFRNAGGSGSVNNRRQITIFF